MGIALLRILFAPLLPSPSLILRRIITHSPELVTFGLAVVVVAAAAAAAGGVALRSSSDSARMLSKRDSTPATACCRNEPHRDACFPGALMVSNKKRKEKSRSSLAMKRPLSAPGGRKGVYGNKRETGSLT